MTATTARTVRTQAEVDHDHRVAVARARRSAWTTQPVPVWILQMLLPDFDAVTEYRRRAA